MEALKMRQVHPLKCFRLLTICPVRDDRFLHSPLTYLSLDLSDLTDIDTDDEPEAVPAEESDGLDWVDGAPGLAEAIAEELDNLYAARPAVHWPSFTSDV